MSEPRAWPDPEPDEQGRGVRAVCGVLLGIVLGLLAWSRLRCDLLPGLAVVAAFMLVCGHGSMRYGDAFWYRILRRGAD